MAFMNARKRNKTITLVIVVFISVGLLATTLPIGFSAIGSYIQGNGATYADTAIGYFQAGLDLMQSGKESEAMKKFASAISAFEEQLKSDPENKMVIGDLATAYYYSGNVDKAIELAQQALQIDPTYSTVRRNYAIYLYYGKNDPVEALKQLEEIKEGDVNYEGAQQLKAQINADLAQSLPNK